MVSIKTICSIVFGVALMLASSVAFAGSVHNGVVLSAETGGGYTYMEIEENGKKFWIAGPTNSFKKGAKVNFAEQLWMPNFESKALGRTFDKLLFVADVKEGVAKVSTRATGTPKSAAASNVAMVFSNEPAKKYTVEEIFTKKDDLNGKNIKIEGNVVKVSMSIMGRNWVHIEDGTGFPNSNRVVFRTVSRPPAVGDKVTATGRLETDKDFGMGYFYPVIVEDSTFTK